MLNDFEPKRACYAVVEHMDNDTGCTMPVVRQAGFMSAHIAEQWVDHHAQDFQAERVDIVHMATSKRFAVITRPGEGRQYAHDITSLSPLKRTDYVKAVRNGDYENVPV